MINPTRALTGIINIEGIPVRGGSSIVPRMLSSVDSSVRLRGSVAYLTTTEDYISPNLISRLSNPASFLCVDFHNPTDVHALCSMARVRANVYLHIARLPARSLPSSRIGMPPQLLHTKMLLFDMQHGLSELWVGSHNWTPRALEGINFEYSLVISLQSGCPTYVDAERYLETIRASVCEAVNPALEAYYLMLQGRDEDPVVTMELEGQGAGALDNETVTIFGTDRDELEQVNRVGRQLYVMVTDSTTSAEHVYESQILHSGLSTASDPSAGGISFSPRRYAFRRGRTYPRLENQGAPPQHVVDAAHYFITVSLRSLTGVRLVDDLRPRLWESSSQTSHSERLDERALKLFRRGVPYFEVPSKSAREGASPTVDRPLLEEKRQSEEFPLFVRKLKRWIDEQKS